MALKVAKGTDVVINVGGPEAQAAYNRYRVASGEANEQNVVTQALADAYVELFGVPFPTEVVGIPYTRLLGTRLDPNLVLRSDKSGE